MSGKSRNGSGGVAELTVNMAAPSIRRGGEPMNSLWSGPALLQCAARALSGEA
jgi:hypothetical protein